MPSTQSEFKFCSFILFIGAFLEAYIIGGITAEMLKTQDKQAVFQKNLEYVKFSMENLNFPLIYQNQIFKYMEKVEESLAVDKNLDELQTLVNPSLCYELLSQYYYGTMKSFWVFKNSNEIEIMYIAKQMKLKVFMDNERVITQGENDK